MKWIILSIASLILAVLIPLSILLSAVSSTVMEPYSFMDYVEVGRMDEGLYQIIQNQLKESESSNEAEVMDQGESLLKQVIQRSVEQVVTPEWMRIRIDMLQTALWDIMLHKKNIIEPISVADLRNAIMTNYNEIMASTSYDQMILTEDDQLHMMDELMEKIPAELNVMEVYGLEEHKLDRLREGYQLVNRGIYFIYIGIILIVLAAWIIAYKQTSFLRWFGFTLAIISGGFLLLVQWINEKDLFLRLREQPTSQIWADLKEGFLAIGVHLQTEISEKMIQFGWILFIFSILLIIVGYIPLTRRMDDHMKTKWTRKKQIIIRISGLLILISILIWQIYGMMNSVNSFII